MTSKLVSDKGTVGWTRTSKAADDDKPGPVNTAHRQYGGNTANRAKLVCLTMSDLTLGVRCSCSSRAKLTTTGRTTGGFDGRRYGTDGTRPGPGTSCLVKLSGDNISRMSRVS